MKKFTSILLVLTLIASLFTALAVTAQADDGQEPAAEEEDLSALDRIGEETEEGYKIKLTNLTDSEIMGMNIQKTTDDSWAWSDELLADGDAFEADETALFCYTPEQAEEAGEAEAEEAEAEPVLYNIQIVFTDWTVGYLHAVDLTDMDEAELHRAPNSLPYLVYTSLSTEEQVDTSAAEQAAFEGELAAGVWDSVTNSGSSSGSSGSSSGGSSEGCVGSGALTY